MARAAAKAQKAPKAAVKKEDAKAARTQKDPAAGADDFNRIPLAKAADTAAMVNRKEKEQAAGKKVGKAGKAGKTEKPVKNAAAGKKPAADQKKKQQRRGK